MAPPGIHAFRAFGGFPHHQNRLAQAGSLFLYPARIGNDERGIPHGPHKGAIIQRIDQSHVRQVSQQTRHRLPHLWIEMDRIEQFNIRVPECY